MYDDFVAAFLDPVIFVQAAPLLLQGALRTVLLSLVVVPLGFVGGLLIAILARRRHRGIALAVAVWVDFFRALPPLVLLVMIYAGLPFAGLRLDAWHAVALAFFLNTGAYYGEVLRAGLAGLPHGQEEAARALGMRERHVLSLVLLPQAVRNVMPDLLSNTLEVVKLTSIASVVALPDLLFQARQAQSITYNASPIVAAAILYFLLLWPLVRVISHLTETRGARS